jgi:GR25 family glycosyltransferase involved in LPS biosynthesis
MEKYMENNITCQHPHQEEAMKSLDLREVKSYVINMDSQPDRLAQVYSRFNQLGVTPERFKATSYEGVTGTTSQQGFLGCAQSHYNLLDTATAPLLVLEDDVVPTEDWYPILEVPEDTDLVYLGVSNWGYVKPDMSRSYHGVVIGSQHDDNFKRVYNMCSTHAILYLNEEIIETVKEVIKECLSIPTPFDMGMARLQTKAVVVTPNKPMVYQEDLPQFTNFTLEV